MAGNRSESWPRERGFPVVLAGPSGSGKTTVARALAEERDDILFSISATTRPRRSGERDGTDYRFLDRESFEELLESDELLEWAEVHGEWYGTPRANLREAREEGRHLLLDIDIQGARSVRRLVPEVLTVFLLPPSGEVMIDRLRGRRTEEEEEVRARLEAARAELSAVVEFDYLVVNDDLETAIEDVAAIIESEERRITRAADGVQERAARLVEEIQRALEARSGVQPRSREDETRSSPEERSESVSPTGGE